MNFGLTGGRQAAMIEPRRSEQYMCPVLRKRNMCNVDKEKHVTRVSADVALTYERDGNYVHITS